MAKGDNSSDATGVPPLRVFVVLMAVLVAISVGVLATREDPPPAPRPTQTPSPDFSLTDAEAIQRLRELNEVALQAFRGRDESLLSQVFAPNAPAGKRAARAIRDLIRDGVHDRTEVATRSITVAGRSTDKLTLIEKRTLFPCFLNRARRDVTRHHAPVNEVVRRTLKLDVSIWLIYDSVVIDAKRSRQRAHDCP